MKKIANICVAIFIIISLALSFETIYAASSTPSYITKTMEDGTKVDVVTVTVNGVRNYDLANEVFKLVNEERTKRGLKPLTYSRALTETAMKRSAETSIYWDHERPCGLRCFTISDIFDGENLGALTASPTRIMESLMASDKHRAAILKEYYTSVGIGCYQVNGVTYWAQHFSIEQQTDTTKYTGSTSSVDKIDVKVNDNKIALNIYGIEENITMDLGETKSPTKASLTNKGVTSVKTQIALSDIKWSSSNDKVFTVDVNGKITATGAGEATLTAQLGEVTNTIKIKVNSKLRSISLPATTVVYIGKEKTLNITYNPSNTTDNKNATWISEDPSIATVDNNGVIKGLKQGATSITAKVGNLTTSCLVIVEEYVEEDLYFAKDSETVYIANEMKILDIVFKPGTETTDDTITWISSDESIATVDDTGEIRVLSKGTVTIKAILASGKIAECTLEVLDTLLGDLDGNGKINGTDVSLILDIYNKGLNDPELLKIADIDGNGVINGTDAAILMDKYNKGLV